MAPSPPHTVRELVLVVLAFGALTAGLTYPLAWDLGSVSYRLSNADSRFAIWNVAWVARTLVVDPLHVFDANIFYPHRGTLAFSEANLGAGALAIPVYWLTRNPYAAHNSVVLLSFVLSGTAAFYLARYHAGDRRAAAVAAISFAFAPYTFGHLPHIQLLLTFGMPLSLLALFRMMDAPSLSRGAALGAAIAITVVCCAYYGIFSVLMAGIAFVGVVSARKMWRDRRCWTALAVAAGIAAAVGLPLFLPYWRLDRAAGFGRTLDQAALFAANWPSYAASGAYAHGWILQLAGKWSEVLFPGYIALLFGVAGAIALWRGNSRRRELAFIYGAIGLLALWTSFGPRGGLYTLLYTVVPGVSFVRAPSRFGVVVLLALSMLAAMSIAWLLARWRIRFAAALILVVAVAESVYPLRLDPVPPVLPAYQMLSTLPDGALLELPVYSRQFAITRTWYMLGSTAHWKPLVNAYSDYTPPDFTAALPALGGFPDHDSFPVVNRFGVRYALFHLDRYEPAALRADLLRRLDHFDTRLRPLWIDHNTRLYEIVDGAGRDALSGERPPRNP